MNEQLNIYEKIDDTFCRICFESEDLDNILFSPCKCKGTSKYIHKKCLNDWRATAENRKAFSKCMECNYKYKTIVKKNFQNYFKKFIKILATNIFMFYFINQIFVFLLAIMIRFTDYNNTFRSITFSYINFLNFYNKIDIYYLFATLIYIIIIITIFLIHFIFIKNKYLFCKYYFRIGICPIVLGFIFAILTFFFENFIGTFIFTIFVQAIFRHYINVLENIHEAESNEVLEYKENNILLNESIIETKNNIEIIQNNETTDLEMNKIQKNETKNLEMNKIQKNETSDLKMIQKNEIIIDV